MSSIEQGATPDELASLTGEIELPAGNGLRAALQARLRDGRAPDEELRRLAGVLCGEAHRRGMRAEQLVLLLKRTWLTIPEVSDRRNAPNQFLERLISICIAQYYASDRDD